MNCLFCGNPFPFLAEGDVCQGCRARAALDAPELVAAIVEGPWCEECGGPVVQGECLGCDGQLAQARDLVPVPADEWCQECGCPAGVGSCLGCVAVSSLLQE